MAKSNAKNTTPSVAKDMTSSEKALRTAIWARIMTKYLISRSSKGGVKWQLVEFNGKKRQESYGIVDLIAIRKDHKKSQNGGKRGDLFEIILIQVKGGTARFPSEDDVGRLMAVRKHHNADKVVLVEWKKGKKLDCYEMTDMKNPVDASKIFGKVPKVTKSNIRSALAKAKGQ